MSDTKEISVVDKQFFAPLREDWIAQSGLSEAEFMREVSFAVQHLHKNPYLQECTRASILRSVINLAQVGLTLNPISKLAYLVPRWNGTLKVKECVLEPDYRGLVKLLTDAGSVKSVTVNLIYEGDLCDVDMATEQKVLKHVPYFLNGRDKGAIIGVYSIATLPDDSKHFEPMSFGEVCEIRDRSESYKAYMAKKIPTCIWVTDVGEMCRKTVLKRHTKYLPKSNAMEKLDKAIDLDNQVHGFEEPVDFGMMTFVEGLIQNSTLNSEHKEKLFKEMAALESKTQAFKMIDYLKECQPIVGRDYTPHTVKEQGEAIRNAVDLDDFKERNRK